eukprot:Seg3616.3 transcript_id=Seg3616.3/GoldUCD/mRNA.D3Y31 product="28S ribosomal protein S7 mitochondrial" pseudo=true protein_id=Seg3616.3/GoldUCD/D3Y31
MATLNISKSFVRCLFFQASYSCRCLSNIAAQKIEDAPKRKPNRKQKVLIVTEEEAAKLKRATDSQLVKQSQFDDELVNKFVNCMMWDGKKALARNIMKSTFEKIKEIQLAKREKSTDPDSIEVDAFKIFHKAIENSKPYIGCQTMKKGGKNYMVPTPLPDSRRRFLAIKWMITAAREQNGPKDAKMYNKLAKELLDAYNEEGTVIRKKNELHKVAEANRAFAHFRWW